MSLLRRIAALRLVALLLVALTAAGASLPTLSRLAAGEPDHVCHCSARGGHAHCACPKCFPELADDGLVEGPVASSRCGDDDAGWATRATIAIGADGFVLAPPTSGETSAPPPPSLHARDRAGPEPPPPKSIRS